jgi:hypothetical protein
VLALIVPIVIQALLAALRFFHSGLAPLVSIQSWNATVTVGAVLPLLALNELIVVVPSLFRTMLLLTLLAFLRLVVATVLIVF